MISKNTKIIYVTNLDKGANEEDIIKHFSDIGIVKKVKIIHDYAGRRTGHLYVEFETNEMAKKAVIKKDQTRIGSKYLSIQLNISSKIENYFKEPEKIVEPIIIPKPITPFLKNIPNDQNINEEYSYYSSDSENNNVYSSSNEEIEKIEIQKPIEIIKNKSKHRHKKRKDIYYSELPE